METILIFTCLILLCQLVVNIYRIILPLDGYVPHGSSLYIVDVFSKVLVNALSGLVICCSVWIMHAGSDTPLRSAVFYWTLFSMSAAFSLGMLNSRTGASFHVATMQQIFAGAAFIYFSMSLL